MSGHISEQDRLMIVNLLTPIVTDVGGLKEQQTRMAEKQDEMLAKQYETHSDFVILKHKIEGNGSPGLIQEFRKHVQHHEELNKERKKEEDKDKQLKLEYKKMYINMVIAIISSGAFAGALVFILGKVFQ